MVKSRSDHQKLEEALAVLGDSLGLFFDRVSSKLAPAETQLWQSIQSAFAQCQGVMAEAVAAQPAVAPVGSHHFDIIHWVQKILASYDMLFLQRQLRYNVTTTADLPKAYAQSDQILQVLTTLIGNAIQHSVRATVIDIHVKEVALRQGNGVEVSIVNACPSFTERDRYRIFEQFYQSESKSTAPGVGLALSREIIQKNHGQLWVDIPEKGKVAFTFVLPCTEVTKAQAVAQTFKYDIRIDNFQKLQHDLGLDKIHVIMNRLESTVRQLVRHPIDVVAAFEQTGTISVIYETPKGGSDSVATRISKKLGNEEFSVGKDMIKLHLQYNLSVLK